MNSSKKTDRSDRTGQSTLEENLAFLRPLPFFSGTPLETIRLYAYLAKRENYAPNDLILNQGEPCDRMFLIMSGKVAICEKHHDTEFCLQTLTAEGFNYFGELALLAEFNWFFSARYVESSSSSSTFVRSRAVAGTISAPSVLNGDLEPGFRKVSPNATIYPLRSSASDHQEHQASACVLQTVRHRGTSQS